MENQALGGQGLREEPLPRSPSPGQAPLTQNQSQLSQEHASMLDEMPIKKQQKLEDVGNKQDIDALVPTIQIQANPKLVGKQGDIPNSKDMSFSEKLRRPNKAYEGQKQLIQQTSGSQPEKLRNRSRRDKLNVSITRQEIKQQDKKTINPRQLQLRIKEIAAEIRKKVKKDEARSGRMAPTVRSQPKKINKNDVVLAPLHHTVTSNQFMVTALDALEQQSPKTMSSRAHETLLTSPLAHVRNILKKEILDKVFKRIESVQRQSRIKLKLDPIKHHYPITSFRRSVLQEDKTQQLRDLSRQRQKSEKLQKRKEIFNQSRYQRYAKTILQNNDIQRKKQSVFSIPLSSLGTQAQNPEYQDAIPIVKQSLAINPETIEEKDEKDVEGQVQQQNGQREQEHIGKLLEKDSEKGLEKERGTEAAASIAQLDNLIQRMGYNPAKNTSGRHSCDIVQ